MRLVCISDTHNRHHDIFLPKGDILIHAGDFTGRGSINESIDFLNWFNIQDFEHKILIAGNHDFFFETNDENVLKEIPLENTHYLNDSAIIINGIKFYGSPITPFFNDWAFNRQRGDEIRKHWDLIPKDTDVLITHGPPAGILDKTIRGKNVGCEELLLAVNRIKPKVHIFGHIHESFGLKHKNEITFLNASQLNERYCYTNEAITFNI